MPNLFRHIVRTLLLTVLLVSGYPRDSSGAVNGIQGGFSFSRLGTITSGEGLVLTGTNGAAVSAWLRPVFGDLNLRLEQQLALPSGRNAFRYRQMWQGAPVIGGGITLVLDAQNRVESLYQSLANLSGSPAPLARLSREEAISAAVSAVGVKSWRGSVQTKAAVLPVNGQAMVGWQVLLPAMDPLGDWEVFISSDGQVLLKENRLRFFRGLGLVFDPDPVTALQDTSLRDQDDAAEAIPQEAYAEVELLSLQMPEDNQFRLTGPWVDTSPTRNRAEAENPEFFFTRDDPRFEEVMGYYHLDHTARYLIDLGFQEILPAPQLVEVNGVEADVSFFSPFTEIITTGTGGVDDAEDADVLIHEYGHALMNRLIGEWRGGETALLSEGWCDYLAGDYSRFIEADFGSNLLFNWDGHNEFWSGRRLDARFTLPEVAEMEAHEAGQLWSSMLTEIALASGARDEWNLLVCDHLTRLGDSASVVDATLALLQSDLALTEGRFHRYIVPAAERRLIFPLGQYSPSIAHRPLRDIEDINEPREAVAEITGQTPLDEDQILLIYAFGQEPPDTIPLSLVEQDDCLFEGVIPAPGFETEVSYYIVAVDTLGVRSVFPPEAPFRGCRYRVGPDRMPPLVSAVDSLASTVFRQGEINFSARIIDNLGVASARVHWYDSRMVLRGSDELTAVEGEEDLWRGKLHWNMGVGEDIFYRVSAQDASRAGNVTFSGYRSFGLTNDLCVDNFEAAPTRWILDGWQLLENGGFGGTDGLTDRPADGISPPRQAFAELDESWDLSAFGRFRLYFWEKHHLDAQGGEVGLFELSIDDGENWEVHQQFTGAQDWWVRREIVFDDLAAEKRTIRVRWRVETPEDAQPGRGWIIDDVRLSVNNIVSIEEAVINPTAFSAELIGYPNPSNGRLMIRYSQDRPARIELLDAQGRSVLSLPTPKGAGVTDLNLEGLTTGKYYLRWQDEKLPRTQPIILLK